MPLDIMEANLNEYLPFLSQSRAAGVDIAVFPELGLGCNEYDRAKNAEFGGRFSAAH